MKHWKHARNKKRPQAEHLGSVPKCPFSFLGLQPELARKQLGAVELDVAALKMT